MYTEETITYLAALYAELKVYRAKRQKAAELLRDDDEGYSRAILAGWDYDIGVKLAQIEREQQKAT